MRRTAAHDRTCRPDCRQSSRQPALRRRSLAPEGSVRASVATRPRRVTPRPRMRRAPRPGAATREPRCAGQQEAARGPKRWSGGWACVSCSPEKRQIADAQNPSAHVTAHRLWIRLQRYRVLAFEQQYRAPVARARSSLAAISYGVGLNAAKADLAVSSTALLRIGLGLTSRSPAVLRPNRRSRARTSPRVRRRRSVRPRRATVAPAPNRRRKAPARCCAPDSRTCWSPGC